MVNWEKRPAEPYSDGPHSLESKYLNAYLVISLWPP